MQRRQPLLGRRPLVHAGDANQEQGRRAPVRAGSAWHQEPGTASLRRTRAVTVGESGPQVTGHPLPPPGMAKQPRKGFESHLLRASPGPAGLARVARGGRPRAPGARGSPAGGRFEAPRPVCARSRPPSGSKPPASGSSPPQRRRGQPSRRARARRVQGARDQFGGHRQPIPQLGRQAIDPLILADPAPIGQRLPARLGSMPSSRTSASAQTPRSVTIPSPTDRLGHAGRRLLLLLVLLGTALGQQLPGVLGVLAGVGCPLRVPQPLLQLGRLLV
jgi:hypothetical protein